MPRVPAVPSLAPQGAGGRRAGNQGQRGQRQACYSDWFLVERLLAPGSPALLIVVYLLLMFFCHAAESVIKPIASGKVARQ